MELVFRARRGPNFKSSLTYVVAMDAAYAASLRFAGGGPANLPPADVGEDDEVMVTTRKPTAVKVTCESTPPPVQRSILHLLSCQPHQIKHTSSFAGERSTTGCNSESPPQ